MANGGLRRKTCNPEKIYFTTRFFSSKERNIKNIFYANQDVYWKIMEII